MIKNAKLNPYLNINTRLRIYKQYLDRNKIDDNN